MNAEIIAIGSELLLGQIIDTNSSFIAKCLAENGIELVRTATVGDNLQGMKAVIREATSRSHIVITTGGLGPTEDDLTREAVAEVFQNPLTFQPCLMEQIETLFKTRGFHMNESNRKQAYIPEGAVPIENPKGTAPGFIVEYPQGALIALPGVSSEMEYLMETSVISYLRKRFNIQNQVIRYKVLRACGLGEGAIGLQINDLMRGNSNPLVGTLASTGDIKIRITAKAENPEEASVLLNKMEQTIRTRLGALIYGEDIETLQGNAVKTLEKLTFNLSVVETFTGGNISQKLASIESPSFIQGIVLSSDISQSQFLNLSLQDLNSLKDTPQIFVDSLAQKARDDLKADIGLATFGKILENQGNNEYRVESYHALSTPSGIEHQTYSIGGELTMVKERVSIMALDMLRKYLLHIGQK